MERTWLTLDQAAKMIGVRFRARDNDSDKLGKLSLALHASGDCGFFAIVGSDGHEYAVSAIDIEDITTMKELIPGYKSIFD